MATSGGSNLDDSLYKGSVEDFDNACEPCKEDGNIVEASGYCQNCDEYLCLTCMKTHCRPKPSRHHVVLDKQQMPQNKPGKSMVKLCTISCKKHPSECLKFYCKKHDVTGCGDCMILDHKTCNVDYISTIADGYSTNADYTLIIQKLDELLTETTDKLKDVEQSVRNAETTIEKTIADIKQYRIDVNAYFDRAERTLIDKCDKIKNFNQRESKKINDELKSTSKQSNSIHTRLTSNINNTANLFVWTNESRTMLATLENEMKAIQKTQFQCVEFNKNGTLTSDMSTAKWLGELHVSNIPACTSVQRKRMMDMSPQHKADISVVNRTDTKGCYITGVVFVRENIIVCTDWLNGSVKLVDINQGKLLSTVKVLNEPWDITSTSKDTCAVTLTSSSKIQFLKVNNDILPLTNVIDVNGTCRGIDCIDDKLVVSYEAPPKVEILDFIGKVLKRINFNNTGTKLFKCPYYVAWEHDGSSIYVADYDECSVLKLSVDGTVQVSYKDTRQTNPQGMFVCCDRSVLVCNGKRIIRMSDDLDNQKVLFNEEGAVLPMGICCDRENKILCFGPNWSSIIRVFNLE